jgi:hypothetical protein
LLWLIRKIPRKAGTWSGLPRYAAGLTLTICPKYALK